MLSCLNVAYAFVQREGLVPGTRHLNPELSEVGWELDSAVSSSYRVPGIDYDYSCRPFIPRS